MAKKQHVLAMPDEVIINKIYYLREQKVMLDKDLAELYGVETKRLKEQVKRNMDRFPVHFMFELSPQENEILRSQNATLGHGNYSKYLPYAFTEHGVLMLANVLKSPQAVKVSIRIIDVFVRLRQMLLDNRELRVALEEIRKTASNNTKNIELVFQYLDELSENKENEKKKIQNNNEPRELIGYKIPVKNAVKKPIKKKETIRKRSV